MDKNLARQIEISPQLLEIIAEDPDALSKLNRVQRALLADKATRKLLTSEDATPAQIATVMEALRKSEGASSQGGSAGVGFSFSITLPQSGATYGTGVTIEGEKLEDPTDI